MREVHKGDEVLVRVIVDKGAFPQESLITLDSKEGPISGFIRSDKILSEGSEHYIPAVVLDITEDTITVKLRGSFFTTTGLAVMTSQSLRAA